MRAWHWLQRRWHDLRDRLAFLWHIEDHLSDLNMLCAQLLLEQRRDRPPPAPLHGSEFKVFSQFGDDGIIQYLVETLAPLPPLFVEFGVQDYRESNTRFLLLHDNWRGMVMDADRRNIASIRRQSLYWRHDLTAVDAFVTRDNINALLTEHGFSGEIGLLSIDIDGNDYWVWQAIEAVRPVIVIAEYNAVFGPQLAVTIPYDPSFVRSRAHYSYLYWGCSLQALVQLANAKGYRFAGCNSAGNNAYFVRNDRASRLTCPAPEQGFVASKYRESRDGDGRLTFLAGDHRLEAIADLQVFDVGRGALFRLRDLMTLAGPPSDAS